MSSMYALSLFSFTTGVAETILAKALDLWAAYGMMIAP